MKKLWCIAALFGVVITGAKAFATDIEDVDKSQACEDKLMASSVAGFVPEEFQKEVAKVMAKQEKLKGDIVLNNLVRELDKAHKISPGEEQKEQIHSKIKQHMDKEVYDYMDLCDVVLSFYDVTASVGFKAADRILTGWFKYVGEIKMR